MRKYYTFFLCLIVLSITAKAQTLVAYYPFNGNANDASGNNNNGTVNGAILAPDRFGNPNSAYSFNGTSDFIQIANSTSLQLGSSYTISAWVNHNGFYNGNYQANYYVSKGNDDNTTPGAVDLASGETDNNINPDPTGYKRFYFNNTLGSGSYAQVLSDSPAIKLHQWYYIVATASGNTLKFYINGKLMATNISATTVNGNNPDDLFLGRQNKTGFEYWFNGIMDEVKIYQDTLSSSQVFDNYVSDGKKPGSGNGILLTSTGSLATTPYINIGSGFDFGVQPFTYETWLKRDTVETTLNNYGKVLFVGDNNGSWGVGILNDNTLTFTKVGINAVSSTSTIADTNWHHVAVVYTGTQILFYIDGVASGSPSYTDNFSNTTGNYFIGPRQSFGNSNGDGTLAGRIDETRIWENVALTQTEIRDWMCKKITSLHPAFANLFAYYRFDEDNDSIAYSLGGHAGIFINSPKRITSGASIGDASAYDYTNATKTANLTASTGEKFTATNTTGNPAGIQVYRVDTIPNTTNGANSGTNNKYFGVFQVNGTSPTYTAVYNYNGNPLVNPGNENNLRLFKRADNSVTVWTDCGVTPNTTNKTLTATGQSTEYILGVSSGILPVSLINFNASKENETIRLNWQTGNEINFSHFEVEKSIDGLSFKPIGSVNALNNITNNYSLIDNVPAKGFNYYRLKQINADGNFTYSKIIRIDFSKKLSIVISPNPAHNFVNIKTAEPITEVRLISGSGSLLKRWTNVTSATKLDVSNVSKGTYILKFVTANEVGSREIIIL
ncbi:MAG: LamG domain-containing protein [Bacteroidota bacterium]|nr:LamG domain-containing protein [Bacteroidota bacterium]